jgi:hypothetical protein
MPKTYSLEEALKEIGEDITKLSEEMKQRAKQAVQETAIQTHGFIFKKAQDTLHSTREKYLQSLIEPQVIADSADQVIYSIALKADAGWIEDGYGAGTLIDRVLNNGKSAKIAKDGSEYKIIPFDQKKTKNVSAAQLRIARFVKKELKKQGYDKIINDPMGRPKIGKIATVKIDNPKQPTAKGNRRILDGLTIYQNYLRDQKGNILRDKKSNQPKIKQSVMTFRVMSSKHKSQGVWDNKEFKGLRAFQEAEKMIDIWIKQKLEEMLK